MTNRMTRKDRQGCQERRINGMENLGGKQKEEATKGENNRSL